jgi:NTP pyrophosphatase (non-canonical NTP hydrolase)
MMILPLDIGEFVDSIAGKTRKPAAVAGRLIEEVVELGLAAGISTGEIYAHVTDAIYNQAVKLTSKNDFTVFPSHFSSTGITSVGEVSDEVADVSLLLKDFCHVSGLQLSEIEYAKFCKIKTLEFYVSPQGTIYAKKPHIK